MRTMAENRNCTMYIKNTTSGTMSKTSDNLSWGKWSTSPPTQIASGATISFKAEGAKDSATGTEGSVTYLLPDNETSITINFDVPYSSANSGGMNIQGPGVSNYSAQETGSNYTNPASFPNSGNEITVYFAVGDATTQVQESHVVDLIKSKVDSLTDIVVVPTIDIVSMARETNCGEIPSEKLIKMFQNKETATLHDILTVNKVLPKDQQIPAADLVAFVSNRGLLSPKSAFAFAVEFAAHAIPNLIEGTQEHDKASQLIKALRDAQEDSSAIVLDNNILEDLNEIKAVLAVQGHTKKVAALGATQACIYNAPGADLAQAGSCARESASAEKYAAMAEWQLEQLSSI